MAIPNGSKWTIFVSGELGLLQMVAKPVTGWCESIIEVGLDPLHGSCVLKP